MKIIVRTFAGFESILSIEVYQITNIKPEIGKRAVYLNGDLEIIYSLNLWCRLALDVLIELHHFKASNENELYNGAYDFNWENEFSIHETFSISSVVNSPFFNHSKYASLKIKDARFLNYYEHFYQNSLWDLKGISTHYLVLAFEYNAKIKDKFNLNNQHKSFQWISKENKKDFNIHEYALNYLDF